MCEHAGSEYREYRKIEMQPLKGKDPRVDLGTDGEIMSGSMRKNSRDTKFENCRLK